eukprot:TRINITY_DN1284_c0_g1_i3.p1 TRINITY_DN1284_c0_g1~~TRINITY_DN1284_c0_g1_i3.p1  ORF type:complete len:437 (+),score=85.69 TRINITY_DN1284_c0_g1_i3:73-1383(+)
MKVISQIVFLLLSLEAISCWSTYRISFGKDQLDSKLVHATIVQTWKDLSALETPIALTWGDGTAEDSSQLFFNNISRHSDYMVGTRTVSHSYLSTTEYEITWANGRRSLESEGLNVDLRSLGHSQNIPFASTVLMSIGGLRHGKILSDLETREVNCHILTPLERRPVLPLPDGGFSVLEVKPNCELVWDTSLAEEGETYEIEVAISMISGSKRSITAAVVTLQTEIAAPPTCNAIPTTRIVSSGEIAYVALNVSWPPGSIGREDCEINPYNPCFGIGFTTLQTAPNDTRWSAYPIFLVTGESSVTNTFDYTGNDTNFAAQLLLLRADGSQNVSFDWTAPVVSSPLITNIVVRLSVEAAYGFCNFTVIVLPSTSPPTTPTTEPPTSAPPTTLPPTTPPPTTLPPTTLSPTTLPPTTLAPTTLPPTTCSHHTSSRTLR